MIKDKRVLYKDSLNNICKILEGKVYETEVAFDKVSNFRNKYFSLSERQEGDKMKIRFISEYKSEDFWTPVNPSIEDVFLYVYKDEVIKEE